MLITLSVINTDPPPEPVQMISASMIEPTSFLLVWEYPSQLNSTLSYEVSCRPLLEGIPIPQPRLAMETNLTLSNLNYGVTYTCLIRTIEYGLFSLPSQLFITTLEKGIWWVLCHWLS